MEKSMSHRVQKRARRAARAAMMTATTLPAIFNCAPAAAQQHRRPGFDDFAKGQRAGRSHGDRRHGLPQSLQSALDAKRISSADRVGGS